MWTHFDELTIVFGLFLRNSSKYNSNEYNGSQEGENAHD